jgi:hypothetical protein
VIAVDRADFELLPDSPIPGLAVRVTIHGEGLEGGGHPIVARVGDQPLLAMAPTLEAGGAQGFLAAEPAVGEELRIGLLGGELIPTGVVYNGPAPVG